MIESDLSTSYNHEMELSPKFKPQVKFNWYELMLMPITIDCTLLDFVAVHLIHADLF